MLNISGIYNSPIIDAIAAAAGVPRDSVVINGIVGGSRRMMRMDDHANDQSTDPGDNPTIMATVYGAKTFNNALATTLLDPYLVDSLSWTRGHSVRVAREWGSLS
jgi:hypothetical protein